MLSPADAGRRRWDVVVVGGGHNGLAASAYLARAGLQVLVLERRDRLGGACTIEDPFDEPGWRVSPCAYLVGLLHPLVIDELGLRSRGYRVEVVDPHLWCPFEDGTSIALWEDSERSAAAVAALSPGDVEGYQRYGELFGRIRQVLREGDRDHWSVRLRTGRPSRNIRCGTAGSRRAPAPPGCICAGRRPTPAAASSASTAATQPWPSSRIWLPAATEHGAGPGPAIFAR